MVSTNGKHRTMGEYLRYVDEKTPLRRQEFTTLMTQAIGNEINRKRGDSSRFRWIVYNKVWFVSTRDNKPYPLKPSTSILQDFPYDVLILKPVRCEQVLFVPIHNLLMYHMTGEDALATLYYFLGKFSPERFGLKQRPAK